LLTRGVRGTRVLCLDAETNQHLVRCIAASAAVRQVAVQS
jgi:DUF2075 family protein